MQRLNIIRKHNQKALIFLLKTDLGVFAVAALASHGSFRITDTKLITTEELVGLHAQRAILEKRGITIVDLTEAANLAENLSWYASAVLLLPGTISSAPLYSEFEAIPSPYFIFSFNDAQFFSTQKTRGPNMF